MTDASGFDLQRLLDHWGLTVDHWEKVGDVYKVDTDQGVKNLKVSVNAPARLLFVGHALRHLHAAGFDPMKPLLPTTNGADYVGAGRFAYSLFDWIPGRQCDFQNEAELIGCAATLAEFHRKSGGFTPPPNSNAQNELGKCLKRFEKGYRELRQFKELAVSRPQDRFARLYLEHSDLFLAMAERAIAKLRRSPYPDLVREAKAAKTFCHGDPAARNFIVAPDRRIWIIDFDNCRLDLPLIDLVRMTRRVLKKCHWRYRTAQRLIAAYHAVRPLSDAEIEVMKAVFDFPQKFWRLAVRHFHHHRQYPADKLGHHFQQYLAEEADLAAFQAEFADYSI